MKTGAFSNKFVFSFSKGLTEGKPGSTLMAQRQEFDRFGSDEKRTALKSRDLWKGGPQRKSGWTRLQQANIQACFLHVFLEPTETPMLVAMVLGRRDRFVP